MKINSSFVLPNWKEDLLVWEGLEENAISILLNIYNGSPSFAKYHKVFRNNPPKLDVERYIKQDIEALLPFAFIANSDREFYERYFDDNLLDLIIEKGDDLTERTYSLILTTVINNLNDDRQQISSNSKIVVFNRHINKSKLNTNEINRTGIFTENPVYQFSKLCSEKQITPEALLIDFNINLPVNSKFLKRTKTEILLNKLRQINYKEYHPLSRTIIEQNLFNLEYKSLDLVGHEIISIILESNISVDIHKSWTQLILSIASDPRTSNQSRQYLKWWNRIDEELIDRFIRILSHSEILLFLDAISEFADTQNSEMSRMFESRKQLLVGLSIQNKIEKSRLYLPSRVLNFLKEENPKLELSYVCNLQNENYKCIIYLKIGDNHIIEGSHNCKIRLYSNFHSQKMLLNPKLRAISYSKITTGLEDHYWSNNERPLSLVHHSNGNWKKRVIDVLRKNIDFEVEQLLTNQEINHYRL